MFQLYTRLIAVCLIQADQTLQMASADDLAMYLNKTVPVLEKILQQAKDIAGQLDSNFISINGILNEMTETCTVFGGNSRTSQGELSATQKVNLTESEATQEQIKEMIEERKMIAESVEKAEEEFSKVVLGLPGILDLLGTTAVERCMVVLNVASRFFRKITEKLVRRDTKGCFRVLYKELTIIKEMMYDFFSRDAVDDFEEERMFQDRDTKCDKENSKDLVMSIKIMQIKTAIDLMIQMLLEQGTLGVHSTRDVVWETQARLDVNMRTLKKITGDYANFRELVSSLSDVCQTILDESRSMHPSEETYQKVIGDLLQAQDTLDVILKTIKSKLDAILSKQKATTPAKIPQKSNYKGYLILEHIAEGRFTKGKELHSLWRRYDRHTENISSHFEAQKETAETLSQLNMEMNVLERKLDLMTEANRDLTSLQRDIQTISSFAQQVSNAIETKLCPKTFKLIQQMRRCLATLRRTENERVSGLQQETVKRSERGSISSLQQETLRKEIREAGLTAKQVYQCSKKFIKICDPDIFGRAASDSKSENVDSKEFTERPLSLKEICDDDKLKPVVNFTKPSKIDGKVDKGKFSFTIKIDYKEFAGLKVQGQRSILETPDGDVRVYFPDDVYGLPVVHAHTNLRPFMHAVPESECFVSAVADVHFCSQHKKGRNNERFRIRVRHCLEKKEDRNKIKVRHGDIYTNKTFMEVPEEDIEVDDKYVYIWTDHFSQFICSCGKSECGENAQVLLCGSISPPQYTPRTSSVRVYACSPLYKTNAFRKTLLDIEARTEQRRTLLDHSQMRWDSEMMERTKDDHLYISIHPEGWKPRSITSDQRWDETRLIHKIQIKKMDNIFFCDSCRRDPSYLAHFDFVLPDAPSPHVSFDGDLKMYLLQKQGNTSEIRQFFLVEQSIRICPVEPIGNSSNEDDQILNDITELLIITEADYRKFLLKLGYKEGPITQQWTNYQNSIETAAWKLTCRWWDSEPDFTVKAQKLLQAVEEMGKGSFKSQIETLLRRSPNYIENKQPVGAAVQSSSEQ